MAITKEQLKKLGIEVEKDDLTQDEIDELFVKRVGELTAENSKLHTSISKVNSENAEYKRKEQDRLSEEQKKELHEKEMVEKIAKYEKQIAKTSKVAEYMEIGYPKELAEKVADAELEGKPTAKLHAEFVKSREETIKAELMKDNPTPKGAGGSEQMTLEGFKKLTPTQLAEFAETHPVEFENFANQSK